jgi:gamma-glutamyltranspeptidase/glutathione hydrolase
MTLHAQGGRYAIATPHFTATGVGEAVFRQGGNAIDAAVAAAVALTVVYPHMCAVGGDIFALVTTPDGAVRAINGSGAAPLAARAAALQAEFGQMPVYGAHAVTVPGAVAAWETIRALGASRSLADLIAPAIPLAASGVPVSPSLRASIVEDDALLRRDPGIAAVFQPGGIPLAVGDLLAQPALAATLARIAGEGPSALYGGAVGQAIVRRLNDLGSSMTIADLERHRTEVVAPLAGSFRGDEVLTAPPNSQGLLLLEILNALEASGVADPLGADVGVLCELFRRSSHDRDSLLADPRHADVPVAHLLSAAHAADLATLALARRAGGGSQPVSSPRPTGDTIALVTADAAGNAVVIIQSIFFSFGSGILEPETGVILHNRGSFFSVDPASPNRLEGGKRPAHTLMPVMVRRAGRVVGVHGTMGGKAQAQIHAQLILRLAAGATPAEATSAARVVVGTGAEGERDDVAFAETDVPRGPLLAAGFAIEDLGRHNENAGHSQLIRLVDGVLHVATDPRCDGAAAAG